MLLFSLRSTDLSTLAFSQSSFGLVRRQVEHVRRRCPLATPMKTCYTLYFSNAAISPTVRVNKKLTFPFRKTIVEQFQMQWNSIHHSFYTVRAIRD